MIFRFFSLVFMLNICSIVYAVEGKNSYEVFVSALPVCLCVSANAGYRIDDNYVLGINYYSGGLPMSGGGSEYGLFSRLFPWSNSFFVTSRVGWMKSTWGHPHFKSDSGASAGLDIGNQWSFDSGFTNGVTWMGMDFYLKKSEVAGLPHGLRYEIGYRF